MLSDETWTLFTAAQFDLLESNSSSCWSLPHSEHHYISSGINHHPPPADLRSGSGSSCFSVTEQTVAAGRKTHTLTHNCLHNSHTHVPTNLYQSVEFSVRTHWQGWLVYWSAVSQLSSVVGCRQLLVVISCRLSVSCQSVVVTWSVVVNCLLSSVVGCRSVVVSCCWNIKPADQDPDNSLMKTLFCFSVKEQTASPLRKTQLWLRCEIF